MMQTPPFNLLAFSPAWLQTLGRFHVVIVHFPIVLLLVAGAGELWRSGRRKSGPSPAAGGRLIAGPAAAGVSTTPGWGPKRVNGVTAATLALDPWARIATPGAGASAP